MSAINFLHFRSPEHVTGARQTVKMDG